MKKLYTFILTILLISLIASCALPYDPSDTATNNPNSESNNSGGEPVNPPENTTEPDNPNPPEIITDEAAWEFVNNNTSTIANYLAYIKYTPRYFGYGEDEQDYLLIDWNDRTKIIGCGDRNYINEQIINRETNFYTYASMFDNGERGNYEWLSQKFKSLFTAEMREEYFSFELPCGVIYYNGRIYCDLSDTIARVYTQAFDSLYVLEQTEDKILFGFGYLNATTVWFEHPGVIEITRTADGWRCSYYEEFTDYPPPEGYDYSTIPNGQYLRYLETGLK